jgi:hypothetical protein
MVSQNGQKHVGKIVQGSTWAATASVAWPWARPTA